MSGGRRDAGPGNGASETRATSTVEAAFNRRRYRVTHPARWLADG